MTAIVVLSGGIDSTAALARAIRARDRHNGPPVQALTFRYGQTHQAPETLAAANVAAHYGIPHDMATLDGLFDPSRSALTGASSIPEGKYDDQTMAATVVPGRNLLFAAAAVARAAPGDEVHLGVHAGDHHLYPDCRPEFWDGLRGTVNAAYGVQLVTPYLHASKAQIIADAAKSGAPLDLSWSCYAGRATHCGRCGTCVGRAASFHAAGVPDPTVYESPNFWKEPACS